MHTHDPTKEIWMYPHVVQLESRRQEFVRELQLIRERTQERAGSPPSATRTERRERPRPATQGSESLELEPELTIERTLE